MNALTRPVFRFVSWLRSITGRQRLESDMDDEISFHLDARTADLIRSGLTPDEARRRSRLEFGTLDTHKDSIRSSLGLRWWDELFADLRYSTRILKKSPGFTIIAVASLALAIGANTTIFSAANEMLFEKLGVPHPDQLRYLTLHGERHLVVHSVNGTWNESNGKVTFASFSYPVYQLLNSQNVLQPIFAFKDVGRLSVTVDGNAQAVDAELVSGNFYQQMQVQPALGRPILPSDDSTPNAGAVAILSDGYWKRAFGRSPNVIGKIISVNSSPVTIIGVNPPQFTGAKSVQASPQIFMPLSMIGLLVAEEHAGGPFLSNKILWWVQLMARAQPGVSIEQAQAALNVQLDAAIRSTMPVKAGEAFPRLIVQDGSKGLNFTGQAYSQPLYVLMAMVGLVLLLACANMANLMLARASSRQKEMSVRLALGAGRWRILRQVLTESLLLSLIGGSLGLLISYSRRAALPKLFSDAWDATDVHIPFDWRVFAFTAAITILTGLLFGLAPAWAATRAEISTALKQGSQTASRSRRHFGGKAIVAFQVALSTLLVFAAGIFLRSIINLNSIDLGFHPDHLVLFDLAPPSLRYPAPKDVQLHAQVEDALRSVPGVTGVSLTDVPLVASSMNASDFRVEGSPDPKPDVQNAASAMYASVGRDFLSTMQIALISGRKITTQDSSTSPLIALVNPALIQKFFPGQNPIGKRFTTDWKGKDSQWITITGVFSNVRYNNLRDEPPPLYLQPYFQQPAIGAVTYIIRTPMKPEEIVPSLRAAVQRVDHDLPLMDVRTQQQQIDATTQQERIFASLTAGFGLLALALACVGIYGIMAYTVSQRTNEIGIRLALGAGRRQVRSMVLKEATQLAILGAVIGLAAALLLGRLVGTMLYGLKPADPISLAAAGSLLLAIALVSSWIPANRASRVEPMQALRHE
jgi:predicted permease